MGLKPGAPGVGAAVGKDGGMVALGRWERAHALSLVVVGVVVVYCARGQWFFGDDWEFLVFRGIEPGFRLNLFVPHNEHWSTLPILVYRGLFSLVGVRTYWPYMAVLIATHLLAVHFLWRVLRRLPTVPPWLAVLGATAFGLYGAGWENLLWAFQIGFIGSLVAGLILITLIDREGDRRRVAAVAFGASLSLMLSGISVVMVAVVGLVALARWGWRKAACVVVPPALLYLLWLQIFGKEALGGYGATLHGGPADLPRFLVGGLAGTLGDPLGNRRLGGVVAIALAVIALVHARRWWRDAPQVLAMGLGAPLLFGLISQGRGALPEPATSRYLYLAAGLLVPLIVLAAGSAITRWRWTAVPVFAAAVALCVTGASTLNRNAKVERVRDLSAKGQLLAALALADSGASILQDSPQSPFAPDITVADLREMRRRGQLPEVEINDRDRAGAALALQLVAVDATPADRPLGDAVAFPPSDGTLTQRGDCASFDSHGVNLPVRLGGRAAFTVTTPVRYQVLIYAEFSGGYAGPKFLNFEAGETRTVVADAKGMFVLQLKPGPTKLCGLRWEPLPIP